MSSQEKEEVRSCVCVCVVVSARFSHITAWRCKDEYK